MNSPPIPPTPNMRSHSFGARRVSSQSTTQNRSSASTPSNIVQNLGRGCECHGLWHGFRVELLQKPAQDLEVPIDVWLPEFMTRIGEGHQLGPWQVARV